MVISSIARCDANNQCKYRRVFLYGREVAEICPARLDMAAKNIFPKSDWWVFRKTLLCFWNLVVLATFIVSGLVLMKATHIGGGWVGFFGVCIAAVLGAISIAKVVAYRSWWAEANVSSIQHRRILVKALCLEPSATIYIKGPGDKVDQLPPEPKLFGIDASSPSSWTNLSTSEAKCVE